MLAFIINSCIMETRSNEKYMNIKGEFRMTTLRKQVTDIAVKELINQGFNQVKAAGALDISRGTLRKLVSENLGVTSGFTKAIIAKHLTDTGA